MTDKPVKPYALPATTDKLLGEIRQMIEEARAAVAATVNVGLTMLYWRIGGRVGQEILKGSRAEYGEEIVSTLSRQLSWSHFKEILSETTAAEGILCGDVSGRMLECPHPAAKDRFHAVRAHSPFQETG